MPGEAVLSDEELAGLVQSVGFSSTRTHRGVREDAVAVAIILAESGGDANAHNDNPATRDDSYGLFQINMYGDLKAERAERYGLRSTSNLFEPKRNAEIAFDLFKRAGNRFTDWSTYLNGSYVIYLPRAQKAVKNPDTDLPTIQSQLEQQFPGLAGFGSLAEFLTDEGNWRRLGMFIGGGVLLVVGLLLAVGPAAARATVGRYARMVRRR